MKKFKKILLGSAVGLTVILPTTAIISCGFGGADADASKKVMMSDVTSQVADEQAVSNQADSQKITVGVRSEEFDKYQEIAKKFNALKHGVIEIKDMATQNFKTLYSTKAASGGMPTVAIADGNIISGILSGSADYAKPMYVPDFMGKQNKKLYDVEPNETDFEKSDINKSHLGVVSNGNGVQFAFPLGYTQTSLYANWRMIDKAGDLSKTKIYAYAPTTSGVPTLIDATGKATKDISKAAVLSNSADYDSIQNVLNGAGFKPESGKNIATDTHHSAVMGDWLGWGPANLYQRIYSITKSIAYNESIKTSWGDFGLNPGFLKSYSMVFKESLGGFGLLASADLSKDGVDMFDKSTQTLTEKGFEAQATRSGFSEGLAKYFWRGFAGYMSKTAGGFINNNGIQGGGPTVGEVQPFEYKQVMFMQNAKWAEKWANGAWGQTKGVGTSADYHGAGNMMTSGDVVKFSLPYGSVTGDSYIVSSNASDVETLVGKRFLKFIEQQNVDIKWKPEKGDAVTTSIEEAVNTNFLSAYRQNADKQKADVTPDRAKIKAEVTSLQKSGVNTETPEQIDQDVERIYKSALKGFDLGNKDTDTPSDNYHGFTGTLWTNTDTDFFSVMHEKMMVHLQYFKDKQDPKSWTYDDFKQVLKETCDDYYGDRSVA